MPQFTDAPAFASQLMAGLCRIKDFKTAAFPESKNKQIVFLQGKVTRFCVEVLLVYFVAGCATAPPQQQDNICAVFDHNPDWYDYARASQAKWGTPPHILLAFVKRESSFVHNAKPPRKWFLFIPLGRPSSAKGYAQIQDPAWKDYRRENGGLFKSRSDMEDALDFVGWYNHKSHTRLGISKWNPKQLYLAYHEGHGGYRRGSYRKKPQLMRVAAQVDRQARAYGAQLRRCESRFRCRKWYQFGPLCRN